MLQNGFLTDDTYLHLKCICTLLVLTRRRVYFKHGKQIILLVNIASRY